MATWTRIVPGIMALVLGMAVGLAGPASAGPTSAGTASGGTLGVVGSGGLVQRLVEDRVLSLTNRQRRAHGCRALRSSVALRKAARKHTVAMAAAGKMTHQLPGEPPFSTRITQAGYTDWYLVAENVAEGFTTPRQVVRAWMKSPSHRKNMLNCKLRDLGVGVVLQDDRLWWTQNFGSR